MYPGTENVSALTHEVDKIIAHRYFKDPKYPNNKPVVRCELQDVAVPALLDPGADISVISRTWVVKNLKHPHMYALIDPVLCYPYNKDPDHNPSPLPTDEAALIYEVLYEPLTVYSYTFSFPIHLHPEDIPLFILGNDYLSRVDLSINVNTRTIQIPKFLKFRTEAENYRAMNKQGDYHAFEYLVAYTHALAARRGIGASSTRVATRNMKGIELNHNEFFIYPRKEVNLWASHPVHLPCHTPGVQFRRGCCYAIRAVTRGPLGDLQVLSPHWVQTEADSDFITLPVATETAVTLTKTHPCAIAKPIPEACVDALSTRIVSAATSSNINQYPEFLVLCQQRFILISLCQQHLKVGVKSRIIQKKNGMLYVAELNTWVVEEGDKAYMTPCPKVKLLILSDKKEFGDYRRHAMLAKMLSTLPRGVWYQERPGELPGVPMEDMAVRVRVEPGPPIAQKMRRMAPAMYERVYKQLTEEMELGLWERSNSPWASNITTAEKPHNAIRICADYAEFNKVTKKDKYPIPRMEDIRLNLAGKKFISLVDLTKGFNNLLINPADRDYLAVITPIGLIRPTAMPFGWANGPGVCQREVDLTLGSLNGVFRGYIDDISGGTENNQRLHDLLLSTVLFNFYKRGFRFHADKAQLLADRVRLVGCYVDATGITPSPKPGLFEALKRRNHSNIKAVQKTLRHDAVV